MKLERKLNNDQSFYRYGNRDILIKIKQY